MLPLTLKCIAENENCWVELFQFVRFVQNWEITHYNWKGWEDEKKAEKSAKSWHLIHSHDVILIVFPQWFLLVAGVNKLCSLCFLFGELLVVTHIWFLIPLCPKPYLAKCSELQRFRTHTPPLELGDNTLVSVFDRDETEPIVFNHKISVMVIASTSHFNYSVDQLISFFSFVKKSRLEVNTSFR